MFTKLTNDTAELHIPHINLVVPVGVEGTERFVSGEQQVRGRRCGTNSVGKYRAGSLSGEKGFGEERAR